MGELSNGHLVVTINPGDPMQIVVPPSDKPTSLEVTAGFSSRAGRVRMVFKADRSIKINRPVNHKASGPE